MNTFKTTMLMVALMALLMFIGEQLGGPHGLASALIIGGLMNFASLFFSDRIVLMMYRAREVGPDEAPQLYSMVQKLALQAGLPMPKVYIIPTDSPNAFATGRSPSHSAVAVTEGILRMLSRDELEGVLAHELGHVQHRDTLISAVVATMAGAIMFLSRMAFWFGPRSSSDDEGGSPIGWLLAMILGPIAALMIQLAISRSGEYSADARGARICGQPLALAHALAKLEAGAQRYPLPASPHTAHLFIVNPLRGGAIASLFSTHPPTAERIARLEAMAFGMS